jgi:hypothetical protein
VPGRTRRQDREKLHERLIQQTEDRARLRRRVISPPQPSAPRRPIPEQRVRAWGQPVTIQRLDNGEWGEWSSLTSAFTTVGNAFTQFATTATTVTGSFANIVWGSTMGAGTLGPYGNVITYNAPIQPAWTPEPLTPEEQAARAERMARHEQQRNDRITAQAAARTRARNTLLEFLTPEQRAEYEAHDHFVCIGSEGNRYRIERGNAGNVVYLDERGEMAGRLCAHPSMRENWLPDEDVALAQMLALMTDERNFVRIANVHRGRAPEFAGAVLLGQTG